MRRAHRVARGLLLALGLVLVMAHASPARAGAAEEEGFRVFRKGCLANADDFGRAPGYFAGQGFRRAADGYLYHPHYDIVGDTQGAAAGEAPVLCLVSIAGGDAATMAGLVDEGYASEDGWVLTEFGEGWLIQDPSVEIVALVVQIAPKDAAGAPDGIYAFLALKTQEAPR